MVLLTSAGGGGQSGEGVMRRCSGGITMNTALIIIFLPFFVHICNLLTKYTGEHYKDIFETPSAWKKSYNKGQGKYF